MPDRQNIRHRTAVELPWRTILKLLAAVALVWLWLQLYELFLVLIVAVLLAVTLNPVVRWLEGRRMPRWGAATLVSLLLLAVVGAFLWLSWASLNQQAQYVTHHFGDIEQQAIGVLPPWISEIFSNATGGDVTSYVGPYALRFARSAVSAIVVGVLGFILTVYLLIEGGRTYAWLIAFVPPQHRARTHETAEACERVIFGYVAGNVATSIFAAAFVFVSLSILTVPAALLLALLAGLCDFVPVLGFILSAVPAVLLAGTVSGNTALAVAALYVLYHTLENYLIAPRVYGDRLQLSNVAVILAFAVGAALAGVIGALIALPLAAAYPAVERIWLRDKLAEDTVRQHRRIEGRRAS